MESDFYSKVKIIDNLKLALIPTENEKNEILRMVSSFEYYERYFFQHFDNENWFDYLERSKVFDNIKEPQLTEDEQYIQFPHWWPGEYLVKVVDKIPGKVFRVLKKVKTDNRSVLDDCMHAILNMPNGFLVENSKEIVVLIDRWLDSKYIGFIHDRAIELFGRYADLGFFKGACELLNILSKIKKERGKDIRFRFETYYYKELVKKHLPKLIENSPAEVLDIIEKHLKDALYKESEDKSSDDFSSIWRPSIEDSPQNWRHDEIKDILSEVLRDTLYKVSQIQAQTVSKIIERYLKEHYSIFRRLAIHIIRIGNFNDLAETLLTDRNNLGKSEIYHEFFKLVGDKFGILNPEQKRQFVSWIVEGPIKERTEDEEEFKRYKRSWQAIRLLMIKEYLDIDEDLEEFRYLLDEYKDEFVLIEHPSFLTYHTSLVGLTSPLTKEQIAEMTPKEFIQWIKNNLQPPYKIMASSPEGLSRIFQEVVRENPQPYAAAAEQFLDEKICPVYLSGLIRGLKNTVKEGKRFELESVLKFIEDPLKFHPESEVRSNHDEFNIGRYTWFRGAISSFIETLAKKDELVLSEDIMNRTQKVLVQLIEKEEDPTEESEKKYGPNNIDYVTYCINSSRGKAMHALMHHALRRAQMRPEEEKRKEEGKGPFPPGERMDLYKAFFSKRLDDETSPSVQSSYGEFLPYLFYLDQEWVREMKEEEKLFPQSEEKSKFWEAHWQSYVGFNDFYGQIYALLKEEYKRAVSRLVDGEEGKKQQERYGERLAEHLMIAYWKKLEEIGKDGEILNIFFNKASVRLRGHAIWFLANVIKEVKLSKESDEWKRLKALWENRVRKARDGELAHFVRWLKYCPEDLDDIFHLVKPIIPHLHLGRGEKDLLEYINEKIETNPRNALIFINELFNIEESLIHIHFRLDLVKTILTKARKYKDLHEVASRVNQAINRLGEMGYYDLRDLLVET